MEELELRVTDFCEYLSRESGTVILLEDLASVLKDSGRKNLGGGQPPRPEPIPSIMKEAMYRMIDRYTDKELHSYGDPRGLPKLREAIAREFNELYDWDMDPDKHILIGPGSSLLNFFILNSFAGPYKGGILKCVTHVPQYIGYEGQFERGHENTIVSMYQQMEEKGNGRFEFVPDLAIFEKVIQNPDVNLFKISRQNNPTTQVLEEELFQKMVSSAVRKKKIVLVDEAYGNPHPGYVYGGKKCDPVFMDRTAVTKTLSKSGLAGGRVGFVYSKDEKIIKRLYKIIANSMFHSSNISQALAETLLTNGDLDRIESILKDYFQKNERIAVDTFRKECISEDNVLIHRFDSSFYLFFELKDLPEDVTSQDVDKKMREYGTPIVLGKYFFYGTPAKHNLSSLGYNHERLPYTTIRISLSEPPERLREAMVEFAHAVDFAYGVRK
jgi:alanine-alpha-ketoisovalerate/valine-pyruvate aminotransferase